MASRVITSGWKGDDYLRRTERRIADVLTKGALDIEGDAKLSVHVDTGFLRSTIYSKPAEKQGHRITSEAGATAEYAVEEEFRDGHQYLRPAFDRNVPGIRAALKHVGRG